MRTRDWLSIVGLGLVLVAGCGPKYRYQEGKTFTASHGYADKVVLVGGDVVEGTVTKQTNSVVVLEHPDLGRIEIPRNRITSVQIGAPNMEIKLAEGETLRGKIVEESESAVILDHQDLGRITIPRERIASSKVELPQAKVRLAGGDTIDGRVLQRTDSAIVMEHPTLGRIEIPRERIDSLEIEASGARTARSVGPLDPQMRKLAAWTSREKEKGWGYSLDVSWNSSSGNTDEQVARFGTQLSRKRPDQRQQMDVSYYRKISDGELSDNKLTLGYVHDWLNPKSPWFWFAMVRFDYDEFESWQKRANAQGGPGYHLVNTDSLTLDGRLGLGARKEWGSENDKAKLESLLGADLQWKVTDKSTLTFAPYFFPVVGDLGDLRARISGEWSYLFGKDMNLNFFVGALYEYQTVNDLNKSPSDLRVYLGLRFGF